MIGHDVTDAVGPRDTVVGRRGSHADVADAVEAHLHGETLAKAVLADVDRGTALPDAFEYAIVAVQTAWGRAGLKGFARAIQKDRERRPA